MPAPIGFAVIYRWRLKPGMEEAFRLGWERVTVKLKQQREALGSRLHRAEDGSWVAYAQWPSKEAWEESRSLGSVDPEATKMMQDAIETSLETVLLSPMADFLEHGPISQD